MEEQLYGGDDLGRGGEGRLGLEQDETMYGCDERLRD